MKSKIIRTSTVAISLDYLLKGQLRYLQNYFEVIAVSGADGHLENVKKREGVEIYDVPMQREISLFKDLISLWKLYFYFRKVKPVLVHSITPKAGLLSMTAAWLAGVPVRMHTFTGLIFPSKKGLLQKILIAMDRLLCFFATDIYPEGQGVKNDLINYRITRKPLAVIGNGNVNGINVEYFHPGIYSEANRLAYRTENGIDPDDFVFVFVGRLVGDKGINELIQAFQKIATESEKVKLLLVGSFEPVLDPLNEETLIEIEGKRNIISVGFQKEVRPYYAIANALAFPSYREGFPNVVMQAGAMGLPSIVTNINGCNEIIQNNVNGIIIPPKDVRALENAMVELLNNEEKRNRLAQNARSMIVERYEQQMVWQLIKQEYDKQLNKTAPGRIASRHVPSR